MENDDKCTWISLAAATRNAVLFLHGPNGSSGKKNGALSVPVCGGEEGSRSGFERLPAALTWGVGAGDAAGLASEDAIHDGEESPGARTIIADGSLSPGRQRVLRVPGETELVTAAGSTGSAVAGQQPLSAPAFTGASADCELVKLLISPSAQYQLQTALR